MDIIKNILLVFSILAITSCASNNRQEAHQSTLLPKVTNPCYKINALIKEYDNDFNKVKLKQINSKISQMWKAKYHLVGDNCQIWAWGKNRHTYSCSNTAPNKEVADYYFQNTKTTAKSCLGSSWTIQEGARKNNDGFKIEFTNQDSDVMLAAHMVPTANLFKSEWTIYYYIGNAAQTK